MHFIEALLLSMVPAAIALVGVWLSHYLQTKRLVAQEHKVAEIHVLVNSRLTTALDRIALLETRLAQLNPQDAQQASIAREARNTASSLGKKEAKKAE